MLALITAHASRIRSTDVNRGVQSAIEIVPSKPFERDCDRYRILQPWCLYVFPVQYHRFGAFGLSG